MPASALTSPSLELVRPLVIPLKARRFRLWKVGEAISGGDFALDWFDRDTILAKWGPGHYQVLFLGDGYRSGPFPFGLCAESEMTQNYCPTCGRLND